MCIAHIVNSACLFSRPGNRHLILVAAVLYAIRILCLSKNATYLDSYHATTSRYSFNRRLGYRILTVPHQILTSRPLIYSNSLKI